MGFMPYNGGTTAGVRAALANSGGLKALAFTDGPQQRRLVNELKRLVGTGQDDAFVTEEVKIALEEIAEKRDALGNGDVNQIVTDVRKRVAVVEFEKGLNAGLGLEQKDIVRHIRTPEGARAYGQPIGAVITRDMINRVGLPDQVDAPSGGSSSRKRPASQLIEGDKVNFTKPGADGKPEQVSGTVEKVTTNGDNTTVTVDGVDHTFRSKDPIDSERPTDASGTAAPEPDSQSRVLDDLRAGKIDKEAAKRRLAAVHAGTPETIDENGQTVKPDAPTADTPAPPDGNVPSAPADGSDGPPTVSDDKEYAQSVWDTAYSYQQGNTQDNTPDTDLNSLMYELHAAQRGDDQKAAGDAADKLAKYLKDNDYADDSELPARPGGDAPPASDPANGKFPDTGSEAAHDAELTKAEQDDEYSTSVSLPGEDGYLTELPAVSQIASHLSSLYSSGADFPEDDEYGSALLYAMEDLDIAADGDDDHAMSVLMNRVEKARVQAFGETDNGPGPNDERIEAAGDGKVPMPPGKYSAGDPRNDPEYEQYVTELDQKLQTALANGQDTESQFTTAMPDGTKVWTPDRARLHDEIIGNIMAQADANGVPKDRKAVMMGGLPGAGKSTFLREHGGKLGLEIDDRGEPTNAIVINPDQMKEALLTRDGAVPRVDGLNDDEHALLIHEESSHLAKMLATRALGGGYNVVFDITLGDGVKAKQKYITNGSGTGAKDLGYDVSAAFVDGDMATSLHRAGLRHKKPDPTTGERSFGGRYVPYGHILSESPKPGQLDSDGNPAKSKNRVEYDALVSEPDTFSSAIRMDNKTGEFTVDKESGADTAGVSTPDAAERRVPAHAFDSFSSARDISVGDRVWERFNGDLSGGVGQGSWGVGPVTVTGVDGSMVSYVDDNGAHTENDYWHLAPTLNGHEAPPDEPSLPDGATSDLTVPDDLRAAAESASVPAMDNAASLDALEADIDSDAAADIAKAVAQGNVGDLTEADRSALIAALEKHTDDVRLKKLLDDINATYGEGTS